MHPLTKSKSLLQAAEKIIPGGVNSPVRAYRSVGGTPPFIQSAKGAYLFDVDGNRYVDYVGSWGPMILGHTDPDVLEIIQKTAEKGFSFGAPSPLEVELAETVCRLMPNIEQIRFVSSGTEATMSALRLARGFTGKNKVIKFAGCYHGHADSFLVQSGSGTLTYGTPNSPGVTLGTAADTLVAQFNDLASVKKIFAENKKEIAAVIVEPIAGNMNLVLPHKNFLKGLRTLCDQHNALLIFDEVITGFRVALGGAQALYDVKPDLTTLGKIIGGGMPVGAFGGRADVMQKMSPVGPVYQAGTLSGNPLAMAAGLATLKKIQRENFYAELAHKTKTFCEQMRKSAEKHGISMVINEVCGAFGLYFQDGPVTCWSEVERSDVTHFKKFFHGMLEHGIYLAPSAFEAGFISIAHDDETLSLTLKAADVVFSKMFYNGD